MDIHKVASWATIGSFIVGCFVLYFMLHPAHPTEGAVAVQSTSSINPSMWIFLGGLLVAGAMHVGAAIIQMRGLPSKPESPSKKGQRIFVGSSITPQYLLGLLKGLTSLQAKNAVIPYIGKWMKVSGSVVHVGGEASVFVVLLAVNTQSNPGFQICAVFQGQWKEQLEILREGDALNIIGRINKIEAANVTLSDCEIIDS